MIKGNPPTRYERSLTRDMLVVRFLRWNDMHWLIYSCFLLSGVTGLVYQVLWGRYFQLFIGATSYAHTVVLATFMGGLAIGNALFGRLVDRGVRTLRLYGLLEIGIGLSCMLFPMGYQGMSSAYLSLASSDVSSPLNLFLKLLFAVTAMLVPTVLMGGTLPVLVRTIIRQFKEIGSKVGTLYFLNSAGAMFGCLIAGFLLIPSFGLEFSFVLTALLNILIGVVFLTLSRRMAETTSLSPESADVSDAASPITYSSRQIRGVYAVIFVTGALTMVYELIWIRLLGLVLGSSTYSFSIMLFTFIGGIALGGWLVSRILRSDRDALLIFALCELGILGAIIVMMPLYQRLPYTFNVIASWLTRSEETFALYLLVKILVCTLAMTLPAILIGMTLPLASRVAVRGLRILGTGVGNVFSINTLGNVLGALLGGFVLIPWLGLMNSLYVALFATGICGIVLLMLAQRGTLRQRGIAAAVAAAVFLVAVLAVPTWDPALLNSGLFRKNSRVAESYEAYVATVSKNKVIYHQDGVDLSVVVLQDRADEGLLRLKVNGKTDASTGVDMATQLHLGHIPMLLHPHPKRVLVIGLGSGCTANAVLRYETEQLDIVEISDSVVTASRYFEPVVGAPLNDPRTTLHLADAKEFLSLQPPGTYDVIISEPSNPWIAGIGNLFSTEFFDAARSRLAPGGIMVQWVQLYEMHDRIAAVIFNTFSATFQHVTAWHPGATDFILVGSEAAYPLDFPRMDRFLSRPDIHEELTGLRVREKVRSTLSFLAMQFMGARSFRAAWPGEGRFNSDFFPYLEFEAPRMLFIREGVKVLLKHDGRRVPRANSDLYVADYLGHRELTLAERHELLLHFGSRWSDYDKAVGPALIAGYDDHATTDRVSQEFYFQEGVLPLFGRRALWRERMARDAMTDKDWFQYVDFEAKAAIELTTVFAPASLKDYLLAMTACSQRFPERRAGLEQLHAQLMATLGREEIQMPSSSP